MKKPTSPEIIEDDLRPEYDIGALSVIARGPGREKPVEQVIPPAARDESDDLLPEYHFDYREARLTRFAPPAQQKRTAP